VGGIKDAANVTESKEFIPFLVYLAAIWGSALAVVNILLKLYMG